MLTTPIRAVDERVLPFAPDQIWPVLADVSREAVVNTDEHPSYKQPLKPWKAHQTVNHSRGSVSKVLQKGMRSW